MRSERGAVPFDQLERVLRVRGGQVERIEIQSAEEDLEDTTILLVRVSQADIRAGAARLKEMPSVQNVKVSKKGSRKL